MSNVKKRTAPLNSLVKALMFWRDAPPKVGSSLPTTPTAAKRNTRSMPQVQSKMHLKRLGRWEVCGENGCLLGIRSCHSEQQVCSAQSCQALTSSITPRATLGLQWTLLPDRFYIVSFSELKVLVSLVYDPALPFREALTTFSLLCLIQLREQALNTPMLYVLPSKNFPSEQDSDNT